MKKFLVLLFCMVALGSCSSAGNINVISPSTSEDELRGKVSSAPVTKLEVVSETELQDRRQAPPATAPAKNPPKIGASTVPAHAGAASVPSIRSGHALGALINLLEKKGTIQREELFQEIRRLEEMDRTK